MNLNGTHESPLVVLSILIAIFASYTALTLAGRIAVARGRARLAWLLSGSIAMGSGIWSMHFVAMLAFHLPVPIAYDVPLVALSYLAAVAASAFALFVASRPTVGVARLVAAGLGLGLAIVTMHYTGMAAVCVPARLGYDPLLVGASVLIAISASTVALWLFLWLRHDHTRRGRSLRVAAAIVMGLAIAGMHYTAMAAAQFTRFPGMPRLATGFLLGASGLAVPVVIATFVILTMALIGSITDHWVRDKLAAAQALRESEERYRSVLGDIDEVIFRTDAAGRWTFLNPAWTHITGFTPEDSLGTRVIDSVYPDDRAASLEQLRDLTAGTVDYVSQELRYRTREGPARWVEVHARPSRGECGELIGITGVIRDITERRRAEEAFRKAREAAEAASRAKSEFLSRMSHELRTPLNAILGFGQLVELEATTSGQRESADHILKAGRHLLDLINEVLDITGIESGKLNVTAEPVCIGEVVHGALDLIGPLAAARNIELRADDPAITDLYVRADRQRLKQILLNLIANAVKYNRQGGNAAVTCEMAGAEHLRIVVTDTGPGIAPEHIARLFTAFDRLGAEQTDVEGTGLGLTLSKRLVEAMGGEIGVTSEVGVGSAFWIELPVAERPLEQAGESTRDVPTAQPSVAAQRPIYTILYVEDNLSNVTLVQRILAHRQDIALMTAMQGGLALELARLHHPDLVLLDLHLPDIPGEEVLKQLRHDVECREIPVVVLSADATQAQIDRLYAAGVHAYVTKPLDVVPFLAILEQVLHERAVA